MKLAIVRWVLYFVAVLAAGPLGAALVLPLRLPDGGEFATILTASSPAAGIVGAVGALGLALVMGVLMARLVRSVRAGMIAAGLVLVWPAFMMATVEEVLRAAGSTRPLRTFAVEGALVGVMGVVAVLLLVVLGGAGAEGDDPHEHRAETPPADGGKLLRRLLGSQVLLATGAGVLAGGACALVIAATPLKGQALAGAIVGAIGAAAAGRLVDLRAPLPGLMLPVALLAVVSPLSGVILSGEVSAVYGGTMVPLANIAPFDWLVGGLLGIPLGAAWAGSMAEKKAHGQAGGVPAGRG